MVAGVEYFLPFEHFPWFRDAPVGLILEVEELAPGHLYWPTLDIDLGLDAIEHPERFPLVAKILSESKRARQSARSIRAGASECERPPRVARRLGGEAAPSRLKPPRGA